MSLLQISSRTVAVEPAPNWALIDPAEDRVGGTLAAAAGVRYWFSDSQARIGLGVETWLSRSIQEVVAPDGLQHVANCEIVFDPTYQQPIAHFVRVIRDGVTREVDLAGFEVFRRERDLERAKVDGRLTAHLVISDLRVGDLVDCCYSVAGSNPIYAGLFAANISFQWSVPVARTRYRLLTDVGRVLSRRDWNAPAQYSQVQTEGAWDQSWVSEFAEPSPFEQGAPAYWIAYSRMFLCDTQTWKQVSESYRALFREETDLPRDLEDQLQALRQLNEKERVAAALRLVQNEVRYLAISIGAGGLKPRSVDDVWQTRFGDCKDVAKLLTKILNSVDISATPALVNTAEGEELDQTPASMMLFDHCIVRVECGQSTYWLDPTRPTQWGSLDMIGQARFGWALPLTEKGELEHTGQDKRQIVIEVDEDFTLGRELNSPAQLEVKTRYYAWRADQIRTGIANNGLAKVEQDFADFYRNLYGEISTKAPIQVQDDVELNQIQICESYYIERPWKLSDTGRAATFSVFDQMLAGLVPISRTAKRSAPIALGWPREARQRTVVNLPFKWDVSTFDHGWKAGPLTATATSAMPTPSTFVRTAISAIDSPIAAPNLADRLCDIAEEIHKSGAMTFTHPVKNNQFDGAARSGGWPLWPWIVLGVGLINAARLLVGG